MPFFVGQIVLCINADHTGGALKKGNRYVVKSMRGRRGVSGFILIHNGGGEEDGGWLPSRFRPLPSTESGFKMLEKARRDAMVKVIA